MQELLEKIEKRRTFAIISHPDAGKTTLTEKLLLYGGAIHLAGTVKARKSNRHAVSDSRFTWQARLRRVKATAMPFRTGWRLKSSAVFPLPALFCSLITTATA